MNLFRKSITKVLKKSAVIVIAGACAISTLAPLTAHAATATATTNPTAAAKISFTFDDGLQSATTQAAPTLAKYGLSGTNYVITGCVGMTTVPNTCRANTDAPYMTWAQIQALQNTYGWEIGSHTVDHDCLASNAKADPDDCQTATLTQAQVDTELTQSQASLAANGITATDIAPPYGDYNNMVLAQIAKYYGTMRQFKNASNTPNVWPYSEYYLQDFTVQQTTDTVATVETAINNAITNKQWLILAFHDIVPTPSTNPDDYQYSTAELDQIAAYVKTKQTAGLIQSTHVNQATVTNATNMLPNGTFDSGVASGWTTPNPTSVTKDTANNGSYPSPTNSIKLVGGTSAVRLYSPKVSVNANTSYLLKNFLNTSARTAGQVEFYIDEYDVNGNWISGQYKGAENSAFVENLNYTYTPSSPSVASADIQVTFSAGGKGTAYLDNSQWFPLSTTAAPTPTSEETFENGFDGWTNDSAANITIDKLSNGSPANPVSSVKLVSGTSTTNTHLFAPKTPVVSTGKYTITSYVNMKAITSGELGFYIDEYDANGNWISGQYKTGVRTVTSGDVSVAYTPTSANVKTASLQVIVTGNSGITAYFDDVRWYAN